jgi:CBS domain-containing protein
MMQIGHICTKNTVTCSAETSVIDAARMMRKNHVGTLIVVEEINGMLTPQGIVTDRDIVVTVLAEGLDPKSIKVADIMKVELMTAVVTEDIFETVERMRYKGVRRIPVVDKHGALAGIVSVDDIWKFLARGVTELADVTTRQQTRERVSRGR